MFLPMVQYEMMREDMILILAKVLKKYLPQLKLHLESVPDRFGQDHSEFSHKTLVIALPVLNLNENCEQDAIKILDFCKELVEELSLNNEEPIQIGGNQLTRKHFGTYMNIRLGNLHKRFANFGPTTFEFFHLDINFLDKIGFEPLWSSLEEERGTLYGEKEQISRNCVDTNVIRTFL